MRVTALSIPIATPYGRGAMPGRPWLWSSAWASAPPSRRKHRCRRELRSRSLAPSRQRIGPRLPVGPVVVTLRRATLPAGTTLPAPAASALEVLYVEAGTLEWSVVRSADTATPGVPLSVRAGESVPFAGPPPGAAVTARNAGNNPTVVLDLTVAPANPGAAFGPRSRSLASIATRRTSVVRIASQAPVERVAAASVSG